MIFSQFQAFPVRGAAIGAPAANPVNFRYSRHRLFGRHSVVSDICRRRFFDLGAYFSRAGHGSRVSTLCQKC
jgi:hypothetical protein